MPDLQQGLEATLLELEGLQPGDTAKSEELTAKAKSLTDQLAAQDETTETADEVAKKPGLLKRALGLLGLGEGQGVQPAAPAPEPARARPVDQVQGDIDSLSSRFSSMPAESKAGARARLKELEVEKVTRMEQDKAAG